MLSSQGPVYIGLEIILCIVGLRGTVSQRTAKLPASKVGGLKKNSAMCAGSRPTRGVFPKFATGIKTMTKIKLLFILLNVFYFE